MRYLKLVIGSVLILFLLMTGIGLLMPSSVSVVRFVNINAPVDSVRYYTDNIKNWKLWLSGIDSSQYKIISNHQIQLGSYKIDVIEENSKHIITSWKNQNNKEQISTMQLLNSNNLTLINWSLKQENGWLPWNRIGGMLHDKIYGPSMEASLNKLKQIIENHE